ncbi:MAG: hypothetical protein QOH03_5104, partial [Kribbellaceae bacterium]|nr:hypothetical protein [Kribbellaceae bacterium]
FAVLLVYFLMVVNFQSWLGPFIILTALPGALAGVLWALFVTHTTFSVPALMGCIMAIGVATSNSILMVTFANEQRREGLDARGAALAAGSTRLRPVLMTALAMIVGMVPMSLGLGEGGEQNAPLGRAVIGGLLVATVFTLVFVPVAYAVLRRKPPAPEPTDPPATQPTEPPATQPTEPPATQPTDPPATQPTDPPTAPATQPTDNGSTGENPSGNPSEVPSAPVDPPKLPTTLPTTLPSDGSETSTGNGGDNETTPALPSTEAPVTGDGNTPGGAENPVSEIVKSLIPVLPTPTGAPIEEPARLEQYFGKGFTGNGKHSSGKPALGWARSQYAKGKHSTGHYAEGRHAAITRAHGSMAPVTIRQILGVLNTPMSDR